MRATISSLSIQTAIGITTAYLLLFCCAQGLAAEAAHHHNPFPYYTVLEPNVLFWKKVYSEYSLSQSIIHDKTNPSLIYDVIEFNDNTARNARRARAEKEKKTVKKYCRMLRHLASGHPALTADEKRVASLFGPEPDRELMRQAARNIRCQRGQKERFLEGVQRSGAYIDEMKAIFRSYGLPEDLCYLPHVESSFRYWARSKCGAAGMWQFMKGTAKRFIRVDHLIDERRDPLRSTRAAAELLFDNYERLGTWPLAITAYNHGTAGMERAVKLHGTFEKIITEYRGRRFKFASRNFYAEFLAAREVAKELERGQIINFDPPIQGVWVKMPAYVSFVELANLVGIAPSELQTLNPGIRKPVVEGKFYIPQGYEMRLPLLDGSSLALALLDKTSDPINQVFFASQKKARRYRVRRGDTAHKIAARHGISLKKLAALNGLDRSFKIYAGQYLHLPN